MSRLNDLLTRVGRALGISSEPNTQPASTQNTASGQGANFTELQPQLISQLRQRPTTTGADLSPKSFNAEQLVNNLREYVDQGPTPIPRDFISSLPPIQTPYGSLNLRTGETTTPDGQIVTAPINPIAAPNPLEPFNISRRVEATIPSTTQTPQTTQATPLPTDGSLMTYDQNVGAGSSATMLPTTGLIPEETNPQPLETVTDRVASKVGEFVESIPERISNTYSKVKSVVSDIDNEIIRPTRSVAYSIVAGSEANLQGETLTQLPDSLKEKLKARDPSLTEGGFSNMLSNYIVPATSFLMGPLPKTIIGAVGAAASSSDNVIGDIVTELNNPYRSPEENMTLLREKYPEFDVTEINQINQVYLQGIKSVVDTSNEILGEQNVVKQEGIKQYEEELKKIASPKIETLNRLNYEKSLELGLSNIVAGQRTTEISGENNRQVALDSKAYAALQRAVNNDMNNIDGRPSILRGKLDDKLFSETIDRKLAITTYLVENGISGNIASDGIKDFLRSKGYEPIGNETWSEAFIRYQKEPIVALLGGLPEGKEKSRLISAVATTSSVDDAFKSMEIVVNSLQSESKIRQANSVLQGLSLLVSSGFKATGATISEYAGGGNISSAISNAEMETIYVDFTQEGIGGTYNQYKWMSSAARLAPEFSAGLSLVLASNAIGGAVGAATSRAATSSYIANFAPKLIKVAANSPKWVKNTVNWTNRMLAGSARNIGKVPQVLIEEGLSSSAMQAFMPGIGTEEEKDNFMLGLAVSSLIEAVPPIWRASGGLDNIFGINGISDDIAYQIIKNQKEHKILNDIKFGKVKAYLSSPGNITLSEDEIIEGALLTAQEAIADESVRAMAKRKAELEPISFEDIQSTREIHSTLLNKLEAQRVTNPELAKEIENRAMLMAKVNQIYRTAIDAADEEAMFRQLAQDLKLYGTQSQATQTTASEIQRMLGTSMPIRFGSDVSNPQKIVPQIKTLKDIGKTTYSLPKDSGLSGFNFYKPLSAEELENIRQISNIGDDTFRETSDGFVLTPKGIKDLKIDDPSESILMSQIPSSELKTIAEEILTAKLPEGSYQQLSNSNTIENIYNSIKNLC